jgi:hypothetical protein
VCDALRVFLLLLSAGTDATQSLHQRPTLPVRKGHDGTGIALFMVKQAAIVCVDFPFQLTRSGS